MGSHSSWLVYLVCVVAQYTHLLAEETIHMLYGRHIESNFNEFADEYHQKGFFGKMIHLLDKRNFEKDIGINADGRQEMKTIWKNFTPQILSINHIKTLLNDPKAKIQFACMYLIAIVILCHNVYSNELQHS